MSRVGIFFCRGIETFFVDLGWKLSLKREISVLGGQQQQQQQQQLSSKLARPTFLCRSQAAVVVDVLPAEREVGQA